MSIALFRIDDRLIHGQVVVGWGAHLDPRYIAVVDDALARSDWEQELYRAGLPEGIEARFLDLGGATRELPLWNDSPERGIVLTRDIRTMRRLAESGVLAGQEVNLGGLHDAPGRERILPYLFLNAADREELARLLRTGVHVSARDLPAAKKIDLRELLNTGPG